MRDDVTQFRVRKGLLGTSVLQKLSGPAGKVKWEDVKYNAAPRALVEKFESSQRYEETISDLEADNERLSALNQGLERLIEHLQKTTK